MGRGSACTPLEETLAKAEELNKARAAQIEAELAEIRSQKPDERGITREDEQALAEAVTLLSQPDDKQLPADLGRQVDAFLATAAPLRQKGVLMKRHLNGKWASWFDNAYVVCMLCNSCSRYYPAFDTGFMDGFCKITKLHLTSTGCFKFNYVTSPD